MKPVKCVVWDLDNTVWDGTLLESPSVSPRPGIEQVIRTLDERGILHSIASRNDADLAMAKLREFGLAEYFLVPQIGWGTKSASVRAIAEALNLGLDAFAFVDDEPFERGEVAFELPQVRCIDAAEAAGLAGLAAFTPASVTDEARGRRALYQAEQARKDVERDFEGPAEAFLASLAMRFRIALATEEDLDRAEELTVRTNQLNTTGRTYSRAELAELVASPDHIVLVARLDDRLGPYGTIGLTLVERGARAWTIKLLLMSCRVLSRGVGTVLITYLRNLAAAAGVRLLADFLPTGRNRMMQVTYRMNGFREIGSDGELRTLEADEAGVPPYPDYVQLETPDLVGPA